MATETKKRKKGSKNANNEVSERFAGFTMAHPLLTEAFEQVLYEVNAPTNEQLVFVVGPPGVGKSTLFNKLYKTMLEEEMENIKANDHYLPVAGMEVIAYDGGQFRWKDFHHRYLNALFEPMVENKIKTSSLCVDDINDGDLTKSQLQFAPGLRRAVEKALKRRGVKAFLLDEAQHFAKVRGGRRLLDQLDYIKSLANTSGVKHVLFGTYQMLLLWNLSGQLARRSKVIHLPRYRLTIDDEVKEFKGIVETFEEELGLPEQSGSLVDNWEDIYVRCAGCVGILKMWMHRALSVALQRQMPAIDYKFMTRFSLTAKQLQKIAEEISYGERMLFDADEGYAKAKLILMRDPAKSLTQEQQKYQEAPPPVNKSKRRVGERKPSRDKVGRKRIREDNEALDAA